MKRCILVSLHEALLMCFFLFFSLPFKAPDPLYIEFEVDNYAVVPYIANPMNASDAVTVVNKQIDASDASCGSTCGVCNPDCGPAFDSKGRTPLQRAALCRSQLCITFAKGNQSWFEELGQAMCCVNATITEHTSEGSRVGSGLYRVDTYRELSWFCCALQVHLFAVIVLFASQRFDFCQKVVFFTVAYKNYCVTVSCFRCDC